MNDIPLLAALRQSADPKAVDRIEQLIEHGADRDLNRINALAFAAEHNLDPQKTIAAFLHSAQLGLFEMSWNVLCPSCGGVLDASETLQRQNLSMVIARGRTPNESLNLRPGPLRLSIENH